MKPFYLTTTLPYVNAEPHIGFALEIIQADAIVRYQRLLGREVFYNTGTDEHGLKIYRKAVEAGIDPQAYCDEHAAKFRDLAKLLNLDNPIFVRTTDPHHIQAAQEFWKICAANGDIYKKNYKVKYCVGCELAKTDSELVDDNCPIHPNMQIELINEENYFFKFSSYAEILLKYYKARPHFVVPENRQKEICEFVKRGLNDFSISRLKEKLPWGIPVPGDEAHVMYVWFDALINYISTLGWQAAPHPDPLPRGEGSTHIFPNGVPGAKDSNHVSMFEKFWGTKDAPNAIQVAGKDNLRQQTAMWQAMLASAGLPFSKQVFIHGFVTSEGKKMSKSLGNVVDPYEIVKKYGIDPIRYYLLGAMPSYDDGDFSIARFEEVYNSELANGVGNLTSRILTMLIKYNEGKVPAVDVGPLFDVKDFWVEYGEYMETYEFDKLVGLIRKLVSDCDRNITESKPWELIKKGIDVRENLYQLAESLRHIGLALLPIMPCTARKILTSLGIDASKLGTLATEQIWAGLPKGGIISKSEILFPKLVRKEDTI